jgi:hypothetical protein
MMNLFKYINMNQVKFTIVIFLGALIGANYACMRDEFIPGNYNKGIEWTPTFEGPVAYGNLSLNDILTRADTAGLIFTDDSGQIIFAYEGALDAINANEWVTIPPQEFKEILFSTPVDIPGIVFGSPGTERAFTITDDYQFVFKGDERIDSMLLDEGSLIVNVRSSIHHIANIYLSSPNIFMPNGDTLNEIIPISDASGDFTSSSSFSLDGGKLILDNSNPDSLFIALHFILVVISSGADILASEAVNITLNMGILRLNSAYGSIGQYDTLLLKDQELNIDLFQGNFSGSVRFNDPRLTMNVHNSFGLPIAFGFENTWAQMKDGSINTLEIIPDLFILNAPGIENPQEIVSSTISINRDGSNIEDFFTTDLRKLVYSVRLVTNPVWADTYYNFFTNASEVSVDYDFELPMNLRVNDLVLQDTIDFSLSLDDEDMKLDINALQVRIETDNGMPVDVSLQVYFEDSSYNILDSLYSDGNRQILISGELDPTGRVIAPTNNISIIDLSQGKIDNILDAAYALIQVTAETTNSGQSDVRFFSDYNIGFKLGTRVEAAIEIEDKGN